ncbi:LOW QUALITY PROTEIN: hypothetical protein OSB04_010629 [Centaurea solstitialis]|uniref:Integrase catalytic domain-containing protein n=1 Tax=Centaurea solstitialis TaxID=347529 RepID=A0AA38TJP3_9ASTR|nr:LOW QUALITY PROTEIN: hypothetical protein OSB04_010629 [Centaurea solstitialis]
MHNLLSISQLCDKNHKVSFPMKKCTVKNKHKEVILTSDRKADVYIIDVGGFKYKPPFRCEREDSPEHDTWQSKTAGQGIDVSETCIILELSIINMNTSTDNTLNQLSINKLVTVLPDFRFTNVSLCSACEKGKQTRASFKSNSPLHLLHMDLFGPVNIQSIGGKKYTLVIVDEIPVTLGSSFYDPRKMEKLNNLYVRSIRSDHGTEFKNSTLETFFDEKGILQNFSSVRTPQQNGVAERRNGTLIEAARSMLSEANHATQFWAEAVNTACYTQISSHIVKHFRKTGYEWFRNRKPSIEHFHIFGCSSISKTYRVFNKRRQTIEETIHVRFDESGPSFPHPHDNEEINQWADSFLRSLTLPLLILLLKTLPMSSIPPQIPIPSVIDATPITQVSPETDQPSSNGDLSTQPHHPIDQVLENLNSGVKTRHQSGNICLYVNFISEIEPKKIEDAMCDPAWVSAMQEEISKFIRNNLLGSKWIFKNKFDEIGIVIRNKARLVAEEVYVAQPPGFVDPKFPDHAYKLIKTLYGLKQAPRAWYDTLSTFFLSTGLERGKIDSTMFLKKYEKHFILVQIYVDDIIFGSTNPTLCKKFELLMQSEYKMSMMGDLTYFLGLQIKQSEKGIFINQGKYVLDMQKKYDLTSCTPMKTPMAPPLSLDKDSNGKLVDVTLYRGIIGSLLYLTASRLISCILHAEPKESHLTVLKQIFKYMKGTPNLGLWYSKDSGFDLTAYSDSDFAGCKLDRKSTTGDFQLLGRKLVSWTSKKQNSMFTSTTELEYVAVGRCCAQVLYPKFPIYCDNTSAIAITNNPVLHYKTKHIEVRYHFIRDHVMNGDIELHFVPTEISAC